MTYASVINLRNAVAAAVLAGLGACASHQTTSSTVAEVLAVGDGTDVVVTGELIESADREHFVLRDTTGQINVIVDDDLLGKVRFAPAATVRVAGEVDRDSSRSVIKAESVQVVP